ncbi:C40 family peptidase [Estrella lausannensis]|uniref:NLP/P60 family protein n=1 Tax=Estrella lausannensis TaxID=483423 RepID=A0A0H5DT15_9BACT|nr:C40 family peptidase [Estrella lausannensis]CRX39493.1 NLP/P60 family protein [Estrella lausannensis]
MSSVGQMYRVVVPVAELRKRAFIPLQPEWIDRELETQLLLGEDVKLLAEEGDLYFIEAVEQEVFSLERGWEGYRGYIRKDAVCQQVGQGQARGVVLNFNTALYPDKRGLQPLSILSYGSTVSLCGEEDWLSVQLDQGRQGWIRREAVTESERLSAASSGISALSEAKKFLGTRYFWGGRSSPTAEEKPFRGVDCSGLVHLSYKAIGVNIPRNAHDQFLKAAQIPFGELEPGDLIFSSEKGIEGRIDHVMMAAGQGQLIEAVMSQGIVRLIRWEEKWAGHSPDMKQSCQRIGGSAVYAATFRPFTKRLSTN